MTMAMMMTIGISWWGRIEDKQSDPANKPTKRLDIVST